MGIEGGLVGPGFANHKHIVAGGRRKHIVGDAACMMLRFLGEGDGGLQGFLTRSGIGAFEKTIESNHIIKF